VLDDLLSKKPDLCEGKVSWHRSRLRGAGRCMHLTEEVSGNTGVGSYHHKKQAGLLAAADLLKVPHKDTSQIQI
jgi:hypothetical protein